MISGSALNKQFTTDRGQVVQALADVNFNVDPGEFFVLLGPSGSGKTTTLRSVAGIETADSGRIQIGAGTVYSSDQGINIPAEERPVAMVFQSYALWPHMDVMGNITFPLRKGVRKVPPAEIERRVKAVTETLQLTPYLRRPISQLSGGQQQRVALARALALEPEVLLMDEPLSNLDAKLRASLRVEIKALTRALGITTLYVTHDQVEAMVMGDQIAVMNNGAISEQGTPTQLYKHPQNEFVARFLGEMNFLPARLKRDGLGAAADTPWGLVALERAPEGVGEGQVIKLGFRPEDVQLGAGKGDFEIPAEVTQTYYIGDALLCDFVAEGHDISARLANSTAITAADSVTLSLNAADFTAFPDDPKH